MKRGQRAAFRVKYAWAESREGVVPGSSGVIPCLTFESAESKQTELRRVAEAAGIAIDVRIVPVVSS